MQKLIEIHNHRIWVEKNNINEKGSDQFPRMKYVDPETDKETIIEIAEEAQYYRMDAKELLDTSMGRQRDIFPLPHIHSWDPTLLVFCCLLFALCGCVADGFWGKT